MDIILDLNSPSKINKIAELAAEMMAKGGKLTLSIQMSDHAVASVMGPYFEWAGVSVGRGAAVPQPEPAPAPQPAPVVEPAQPEPAPAPQPAPVVAAPQSPSSVSGLLDSNGTPYNPDIHAALTGRTGGKNEAGQWKMKRGVERSVYENWRATKSQAKSGQPAPATTPTPPAASPFPTGNPFATAAPAPAPAPEAFDPGETAITAKAHDLSMRGILTPAVVSALQAEFECDTNAFLKNPEVRGRIWARLAELENSYAG
jgi:hypothetical protein